MLLINKYSKRWIIHVVRSPLTGVWSLIRNLALWQKDHTDAAIGIWIIYDKLWTESYHYELDEMCNLGISVAKIRAPWIINGTASLLTHLIWNPLPRWINLFLRQAGAIERIDMHFHNAWMSGAFFPLSIRTDIKINSIVTFHGFGRDRFDNSWLFRFSHNLLSRRLIRFRASLVSVDSQNLSDIEEILGISSNRFQVVFNGVMDSARRGCPRLNGATLFTIGYMARLTSAKGWQILGDAVAQLQQKGLAIRLILAGPGAREDNQVRRWQRQHPNCAEFKGYVPNAAEVLLPQFDLVVLPSLVEGLPMALIEALARGIPVIATRVGGTPDIIVNGYNGYLIERNPTVIANCIEKLYHDIELHRKLSQGARQQYENYFSIQNCGQSYERVYEQSWLRICR